MSMKEVGSMFLTGQYRDMGLLAGMRKIKSELVGMSKDTQSVTNDMLRMTTRTKLLAGALGLIGIGGFASMIGMMPRVNAQLSLAKTYVSLIALELDENFAPIIEFVNGLLEDFVNWFQELPEPIQTFLGFLAILTGTGLAGFIIKLGTSVLKLGGFKSVLKLIIGPLKTFGGWILKAALGIGGLIGPTGLVVLGIGALFTALALVADYLGFFDWIDNIMEGFREAREEGDLWAAALAGLLSPLELLGDAIDLLLGRKSWDDFKKDVNTLIDDFLSLKDAVLEFVDSITGLDLKGMSDRVIDWVSGAIHDVGTANVTYTGWHWLKAGETVSMRGMENVQTSGTSGKTYINNRFGNIVLNNGMDVDEFISYISKTLASNVAWGRS